MPLRGLARSRGALQAQLDAPPSSALHLMNHKQGAGANLHFVQPIVCHMQRSPLL